MLPDVITINAVAGTPATVSFTSPVRVGNSVVYSAVSPQGDLEGRPTLTISKDSTKNGIIGTNYKFVKPYWDGEKYDGYITVGVTVKRSQKHVIADVASLLGIAMATDLDAGGNVTRAQLITMLSDNTF